MNGLYLQGGGAKGAFQAGVLYGLKKRGIEFNVISGTSIGAINGYFVYTEKIETMKKTWITVDEDALKDQIIKDKVIENKSLINQLYNLDGRSKDVKDFYVNYIAIRNGVPKEIQVNISKISKDEGLEVIKYSSLLPYIGQTNISLQEAMKNFNSKIAFEQFKAELVEGKYDGYNLDGGILNNNFLDKFIDKKVDKLFIIPFVKNYQPPEYILENYDKEDLIIIEPTIDFEPGDTLRFEQEFCKKLFIEGYEIAKNIKL
ncbi:patatin-like phospholipase family protein [Clostridium sp. D2Q-11]|uniref:Patatin-like phospholipase family protein n=1 Tax=Anaeromonas frigoriresistens TaxID=2683708 RepID=A0A942UY07_9FIRM|nr:patatin-like phospholipase family protein [Anaeromonas frigoriresistens]MBS4538894.1 patatin-like phospholipase family protein [Anaeromonas frigoriresistens]